MAPVDPTLTAPAEPQHTPAPMSRAERRRAARAASGPRALEWVSAEHIQSASDGWPDSDTNAGTVAPLVSSWPRRTVWRPPLIISLATCALLASTYTTAMLVWPLDNVKPTVTATDIAPAVAPASAMQWPEDGAAAVGVAGIDALASSSDEEYSMASITKVVTSLVMLEELPLAVGEQGPTFGMSTGSYWQYLGQDESALPVPDDGRLTELQLLQGTLIGSAGNYIDRLVSERYAADSIYADVANEWLAARNLPGITVIDPSGISSWNTATPAALIPLAERAMAHPVFAEIVGMREVDLPGAGLVENTNALLADEGVVGIKTGTLQDGYNVLAAKDVVVDGVTVRIYAVVLEQPDTDTRWAVGRSLFDQVEAQLQPITTVAAGTVVGEITTEWGESVNLLTTDDATLVMWNGSQGSAESSLELGDTWTSGTDAGSVTATGPLGESTVGVRLDKTIDEPTPWWKLTHPLELTGIR